MLEIKHLCKAYEFDTPLKDINATINKGDVIVVIGPSGTGKSTLLRCINCLEQATGGEILLNGENILADSYDKDMLRRKVGMVFQSFNLFGNMNVAENVMFGPCKLNGLSRKDSYEKAVKILDSVGMAGKLMSFPDELSGGQKQRVAIARSLAMDPEIILFDEPTSALDPTTVGEVKSVIFSLAKRGMTMMIVTHDMNFAREIATKVFYLDQGIVYEEGTPEEVFGDPQKPLTHQFMQKMKVLRREFSGKQIDFPELISQLEEFCARIRLSLSRSHRLQNAIEEICVQKLIPASDDDLRLEVTVEHSETDDETDICIRYNGEQKDLLLPDGDDDISMMLINNAVSDLRYKAVDMPAYTNELTMKLR